jgi:hypothetical protein
MTDGFSTATYAAVQTDFLAKLDEFDAAMSNAHATLMSLPIASKPLWAPAASFMQDARPEILSFLKDLGQGLAAPVMFFVYGGHWQWGVSIPVSNVQANISPTSSVRPLSGDTEIWTGPAASAFHSKTATQSDAAGAICSRAQQMAITLGGLAAAGLTFYGTVIATIVKMIAGIGVALAATASTAGVAAPTVPAVVAVALGELAMEVGGMAGVQFAAAVSFSASGQSGAEFPNGAWPKGTNDS